MNITEKLGDLNKNRNILRMILFVFFFGIFLTLGCIIGQVSNDIETLESSEATGETAQSTVAPVEPETATLVISESTAVAPESDQMMKDALVTEGMTPAQPWMGIELTDIRTGEKFRIRDFRGRPVLVETFAVWCPKCLSQQREIKKIMESEGDAILHVALDTDPNEDESKVKRHIESNGFDWYYAVSPNELTQELISDYGLSVVNAPSTPIILVCEDQSTRYLEGGIKSADKLVSEVKSRC
jgi:thiol-disulfide isomerase/thioredoxin